VICITSPVARYCKRYAIQSGRLQTSSEKLPRRLVRRYDDWLQAGTRTSKKKYKMPESHKPDGAVAGSTKRLASRFHQLKAGHCRTGQYMHRAKARPDPQCWWFQCPTQTRDHLFKGCPKWKGEQKILWRR